MKVLVTGVNGQLGHDLMNELARRNIESVGSDITPQYSGIKDGSAAGSAAYVQMDITDRDGVLDMNEQGLQLESFYEVDIHGPAGGVSHMTIGDDGKHRIRQINDMSYIAG